MEAVVWSFNAKSKKIWPRYKDEEEKEVCCML